MCGYDVSLLSKIEIADLIMTYRHTIRVLDVKLAKITDLKYTVLSEHGVRLLQKQRQEIALRLGALLAEKHKRERERYAKRKKRGAVTHAINEERQL